MILIKGLPRGSCLSPILCHAYLNQLDDVRGERNTDDILIVCMTSDIPLVECELNKVLSNLGLRQNPNKMYRIVQGECSKCVPFGSGLIVFNRAVLSFRFYSRNDCSNKSQYYLPNERLEDKMELLSSRMLTKLTARLKQAFLSCDVNPESIVLLNIVEIFKSSARDFKNLTNNLKLSFERSEQRYGSLLMKCCQKVWKHFTMHNKSDIIFSKSTIEYHGIWGYLNEFEESPGKYKRLLKWTRRMYDSLSADL
ncbi:hypothetical protein ACOME3_001522 [Neoechinorhynchus agilis]